MAKRPLATKDNASGQLNAGISAASASIVLKTGEGAMFPAVARASATSLGSTVLLNSTGIQAALSSIGAAVGDFIENVTDGSWAVILTISTNSITTTRLRGGSDNTWQNGDVWAVNRFMVTLVHYDTDGTTVLKREKVLIGSRSTDTLAVESVPSTGRGYDGSTAQSFGGDDYCYLLNASVVTDGLKVALSDVAQVADAALSVAGQEIYGASSGGTDSYAITVIPSITAYTDGMTFAFKADVGNTGAATLNVNAIGAKTIKKLNDQDLSTGDIEAAQIVTVRYNSADNVFEMVSQVASSPATTEDIQKQAGNYGSTSSGSDTYAVTLSPAPTSYTAGLTVRLVVDVTNTGAATLNVNSLGAKSILRADGSALLTGDIPTGTTVELFYDGTNFRIIGGLGTPQSRVRAVASTTFETAARFDTVAVSVGAVAFGLLGASMSVPSTNDAIKLIWRFPSNGTKHARLAGGNPVFSCFIHLESLGTQNNEEMFFGIADSVLAASGTPPAYNFGTAAHIGFYMKRESGSWNLYGSTGNGTTSTLTSAIVSGLSNDDTLELICEVVSGTSARFYVRLNGATVGTLSSGSVLTATMPSADADIDEVVWCLVSNTVSAGSNPIISAAHYER